MVGGAEHEHRRSVAVRKRQSRPGPRVSRAMRRTRGDVPGMKDPNCDPSLAMIYAFFQEKRRCDADEGMRYGRR